MPIMVSNEDDILYIIVLLLFSFFFCGSVFILASDLSTPLGTRKRDTPPEVLVGRCAVSLLIIFTYMLGIYVHLESPLKHRAFGSWAGMMCVSNFLRACWAKLRSPEILPDLPTGEFKLAFPIQADVDVYFGPRWCKACDRWKPPRTHHCRACNHCVLRMDHHCPFLFNCVGVMNHGHFFLMYVFALIVSTHGLFASSIYSNWDYPAMAFGVLLTIILGTALIYGSVNVFFSLTNATVLEHMYQETRSPLVILLSEDEELPVKRNFFYAPYFESFRAMLGPSWKWRLLLPIKGAPCDLDTLAVHPTCSKRSAEFVIKVVLQRAPPTSPPEAALRQLWGDTAINSVEAEHLRAMENTPPV